MAHIYGNIDSKTDLERVFREIRKDVDGAKSRPSLTELYKRAGYLITLTYAPSWAEKFGRDARALREDAASQFKTTARKINSRAKATCTLTRRARVSAFCSEARHAASKSFHSLLFAAQYCHLELGNGERLGNRAFFFLGFPSSAFSGNFYSSRSGNSSSIKAGWDFLLGTALLSVIIPPLLF